MEEKMRRELARVPCTRSLEKPKHSWNVLVITVNFKAQ